jgi:hypothetical protein
MPKIVPAVCLASPLCLAAPAQAQQPLRLMTGPQGGVWVPLPLSGA